MENTLNIGIDKLTLSSPYFEIKDTLHLNINPSTKKSGEREAQETYLFSANGNEVVGSKAFLNTPEFNFTVKWLGNKPQAILQLNPSKYLDTPTLCTDTVHDIVKRALHCLNTLKIDIDLESALVSRLDIAVDSKLKRTFREYKGLIVGKTARKQENKVDYTDTLTFGIGKGTSQFCAYDKGKEREVSQYGKPLSNSTPYTRFEARIFRNKGIKSKVSEATTYNGFLNTPDASFHKAYLHVINTHVQLQQTQIEMPDITSTAEVMKLMMQKHPRTWLVNSLYIVVSAHSDKSTGDVIQLLDCALDIAMEGKDRTNIHRQRKNLFALETEASFLRKRLSENSIDVRAEKQRELFDTFIAPFQYAV